MAKKDLESRFDVPVAGTGTHSRSAPTPLPPPPASDSDLVTSLTALRESNTNPVLAHQAACDLLLKHIDDDAVTAAFNNIPRNM